MLEQHNDPSQCIVVTEPQVQLLIAQKANTQEMSFDWKGIWTLFRRLATGEEDRLLSKGFYSRSKEAAQQRFFCGELAHLPLHTDRGLSEKQEN